MAPHSLTFERTDWDPKSERFVRTDDSPDAQKHVNYYRLLSVNDEISRMWRARVGKELAKRMGVANGSKRILESFPQGYKLYIHYTGPADHPRQDTYLLGSKYVRRFRSTNEFIPHAQWLLEDATMNRCNCKCQYCCKGSPRGVSRRPGSSSKPRSRTTITPSMPREVVASATVKTEAVDIIMDRGPSNANEAIVCTPTQVSPPVNTSPQDSEPTWDVPNFGRLVDAPHPVQFTGVLPELTLPSLVPFTESQALHIYDEPRHPTGLLEPSHQPPTHCRLLVSETLTRVFDTHGSLSLPAMSNHAPSSAAVGGPTFYLDLSFPLWADQPFYTGLPSMGHSLRPPGPEVPQHLSHHQHVYTETLVGDTQMALMQSPQKAGSSNKPFESAAAQEVPQQTTVVEQTEPSRAATSFHHTMTQQGFEFVRSHSAASEDGSCA